MATFVFRLQAPRPTFALDMSDEEREIMGRHAAHWQPLIDSGQMVVFGPVLDDTGSWGLGVVEAEDEGELKAFAARDPDGHDRHRPGRAGKDAQGVRSAPGSESGRLVAAPIQVVRSASVGLSRAALAAGYRPARAPIAKPAAGAAMSA